MLSVKTPRAKRLNRLAQAALASGDLATASRTAQRSLALLPVQPKSFRGTADRANMLLTLAYIVGEQAGHNQSAEYVQSAVQLMLRFPVGPERDIWLAELLTRLGTSLRLAGRFAEASSVLTSARALDCWDRLEPLRRAATLNALGILAKDTGRYGEAAEFYAQSQAILEGDPEIDRRQLAALHHNIAGLVHAQRLYVEAEPEIRSALAIRRGIESADCVAVAADLSVLGAVLNGQGRLGEAEEALLTARGIWEARYGEEHYEVAVQLNNLGSIQQKRSDFDGAAASYHQALHIKERVLGSHHPEIAALLNNIADLESDQGQVSDARIHYAEALSIFRQTLGHEHPSTRTCAVSLSRLASSTV
ncbi:tetratricopeptide repeat protein [Arthrobacter sp. NPDC093125]|uniref:tetratricopeptide repeat protein n=1 Tax=Arthrobacter sp. NPDC093125 TaxID=3363944 RepID=UPI003806E060